MISFLGRKGRVKNSRSIYLNNGGLVRIYIDRQSDMATTTQLITLYYFASKNEKLCCALNFIFGWSDPYIYFIGCPTMFQCYRAIVSLKNIVAVMNLHLYILSFRL